MGGPSLAVVDRPDAGPKFGADGLNIALRDGARCGSEPRAKIQGWHGAPGPVEAMWRSTSCAAGHRQMPMRWLRIVLAPFNAQP